MTSTVTSRLRRLAVVAVAAAIVVGVVLVTGDDSDEVRLTAVFTDANPLQEGNLVKSAGVDVGTVESVAVEDGQAHVVLLLDEEVLPLHEDASATIIDKDLLGERYVGLDRGTASSPTLSEPMAIGPDRTRRVVDLQDVLNTVDAPTGTALSSLVSTLGEGVGTNDREVAAAIEALAPAMHQAQGLAELLGDQNELLTDLVDSVEPVVGAAADERGRSLDQLVGTTTQTLSVVAENRQAVRDTLVQLPTTLGSARDRLAQVAGVSDSATRTLGSLRPVTDDLTDISRELQRFADAADPALASLPPVLDKGNALLDELGPLVDTLQPAGSDLRAVSSSARTLSETALSLRLVDLMEFMKGWAMATSDYDAISHYFKAVTPYSLQPASEVALGPIPGAPDNPLENVKPPEGPGRLPLPGRPGDSEEPQPTQPSGEVASPAQDSATGLNPTQEQNMVDQLLGGGR
ncbi:MlaD family protein [Pseudonocardia pini]|uniref:MlaD family protein n=1 Tax=Pseudonocardia pini TaxID=2758030 RepID=UPI0015EFDFB6|nr:MlaD family protein [Pseudonocardia pini]